MAHEVVQKVSETVSKGFLGLRKEEVCPSSGGTNEFEGVRCLNTATGGCKGHCLRKVRQIENSLRQDILSRSIYHR